MKSLAQHPEYFNLHNPNNVRSLIGAFIANPVGFHNTDGSGYNFVVDSILKLDPINPQVAAGLTKQFARWREYTPEHSQPMLKELKRVASTEGISKNVYEVISSCME